MTYQVTVGLSHGTPPEVLTWAATEASARDGRVRVVRAWRPVSPRPLTDPPRPPGPDADEVAAQAELVADVARVLGLDPAVEIEIVLGGRRRVLVAESAEADLLVVAAPHATSELALQLTRLVAESACPVVVLPRS